MFRQSFLILLTALAAATASAQSVSASQTDPERRPILSRVSGIFDDLPQFDIPGTIKLTVRPHFGDFVHRDYLRTELGLRWSLNENFEISSDASVFITHGLRDRAGNGIGKVRLGSRYVIEDWPKRDYDTSLAVNSEAPVGHPPVDMTDGNYHLTPSFIVQHNWARNRRITTFAGLGFDFMDPSSIRGTFGTNQPHEDSVNGTVGAIYDLGQLKYTMAATYATTAWLGEDTKHFFYLQPGVQWYVPSRFTFHSKTQWIASFGIRTSWGPDGFDVSLGNRLRAEITFRQVMDKIREGAKAVHDRATQP
jgi:hypothetical protein